MVAPPDEGMKGLKMRQKIHEDIDRCVEKIRRKEQFYYRACALIMRVFLLFLLFMMEVI